MFPQALPRARERERIVRLPFRESRMVAKAASAAREPRTFADFLIEPTGFEVMVLLRSRADAEQRFGAYEAACALQLYALDNGQYPASLSELAPKYLAPDTLQSDGPVRLDYRPEGAGYRLTWNSWEETSDGIEPTGDKSEIAIGVPPTPPEKLKKH